MTLPATRINTTKVTKVSKSGQPLPCPLIKVQLPQLELPVTLPVRIAHFLPAGHLHRAASTPHLWLNIVVKPIKNYWLNITENNLTTLVEIILRTKISCWTRGQVSRCRGQTDVRRNPTPAPRAYLPSKFENSRCRRVRN